MKTPKREYKKYYIDPLAVSRHGVATRRRMQDSNPPRLKLT